jgi:hypothetical protein
MLEGAIEVGAHTALRKISGPYKIAYQGEVGGS